MASCSLTNLDGFSTRGGAAPDASREAATAGDDGGASLDDGATRETGTVADDTYGAAVRADQPAAWWRFEDAVGSTQLHEEIASRQGTLTPPLSPATSVTFGVPGAVGHAATFGRGSYFVVGDVFDFEGQPELTLEAWARNPSPKNDFEGIFAKRFDDANGAEDGWLVYYYRAVPYFAFEYWKTRSNDCHVYGGKLDTEFHHVVIEQTKTPDHLALTLYLDGELVRGDAAPLADGKGTDVPLGLGIDWSGDLDELAIYDHALPADRVRAHFRAAASSADH